MLVQREFMQIALGSNEETNIDNSADPGTTGGHSDTASRRIISHIGCEDCCGVYWQWGDETGGDYAGDWAYQDTDGDATTYDGINSIGRGQGYEVPKRVLLGGDWGKGARCGVRCSVWDRSPLNLDSRRAGRGASEPRAYRK